MATKFTGLILASGIKREDPGATIIEALSPFSITILSSALMTVRDRFVFSLLIELIPDHQEAISVDLDAITAVGEIDIAYEFQAFDFVASLKEVPQTHTLRIMGKRLTPADLFTINTTLNATNPVRAMSVESSLRSSISTWEIEGSGGDVDVNLRELRGILRDRNLSFSTRTADEIAGSGVAVLLDMDSTFINEEVIDLIARVAGLEAEVATITERAMNGELDFTSSLKERVRLLAGQPVSVLDQARKLITFTPGATELVSAVHAAGGRIGIVSGGFHDVIDELLAPFHLDLVVANRFEIRDGLLTGEINGAIVDRAMKASQLREFANGSRISVAIGDGANDLDMILAADIGIAFCAKDVLRESAGVVIEERDLGLVLPLIGF